MSDARLPLASIRDCLTGTEPPVHWLVPDFLPYGTITTLGGMPGAGKSFFSYTLSLALATGTPWLGWDLQPRKILYFDQENSLPDSTQYLRWAWVGLGRPSLDLLESHFFLARFMLGTRDWAVRAAAYVTTFQPDLIIIDTTSPACGPIEDENDNAEAGKVIGQLRGLQALISPAPAILALKHAKVNSEDGAYTLRGAKAWLGAVDAVVFQIKPPGRPREDGLRTTRLEPNKTRAFGLREVITLNPEWVENQTGLRLHRS